MVDRRIDKWILPHVWSAVVDAIVAFVGSHSIRTVGMIRSNIVALDSFASEWHGTWLDSPIPFEPATIAKQKG